MTRDTGVVQLHAHESRRDRRTRLDDKPNGRDLVDQRIDDAPMPVADFVERLRFHCFVIDAGIAAGFRRRYLYAIEVGGLLAAILITFCIHGNTGGRLMPTVNSRHAVIVANAGRLRRIGNGLIGFRK